MTTFPSRTGSTVRGVFAAVVSASAYAGAFGLISGSIDLGETTTARLPFHSPVFAGIALALVVGVPTMVASWMELRHHRWADRAFLVSGAFIIGWIIVQMSVIQTVSYLHLVYLLIGLVMLSWVRRAIPGWSHRRSAATGVAPRPAPDLAAQPAAAPGEAEPARPGRPG